MLDRLDLATASVLALLQLAVVGTMVLVGARLGDARSTPQRLVAGGDAARPPRTTGERLTLAGILAMLAVVLGTPLLVLVVRSFDTTSGWGLDWYRALVDVPTRSALFVTPPEAIATSLRYAVVATVIAVVVGGLRGGRRRRALSGAARLDVVLMLPLGTSAVTIGFGLLVALDRRHSTCARRGGSSRSPRRCWRSRSWCASSSPCCGSIDPRLREAAASLGAGPMRVRWEVDVPIVRRAMLVAAGFAFAVSLGEFGATLLRSPGRTRRPFPSRSSGCSAAPARRASAQAMALSTILMVLTGGVLFAIERIRLPGERRF